MELQEHKLTDHEEHHDQAQGDGHFFGGVAQGVDVGAQNVCADGVIGHLIGQVIAGENTQHQHGHDGAHGTQGHQTEAVLLAAAVAQNMGDTHAQSHDEGHGDGAGGDAAGVKCHGKQGQIAVDRQHQGQGEQEHIEEHEDIGQALLENDLQNSNDQERTDAKTDGVDQQGAVHNSADLIGQNLQVRLRHGDQNTQDEADDQQQAQLALAGQAGTHMGAHGRHGQVCAQTEQTNAQNQQYGADRKGDQFNGREVEHGRQGQQIDDDRDGQGGNQRLQDLRF